MFKLRLERRKAVVLVKSAGKGKLAEDLCKSPGARESWELSKNWKQPSRLKQGIGGGMIYEAGGKRRGVWIGFKVRWKITAGFGQGLSDGICFVILSVGRGSGSRGGAGRCQQPSR
jgi:hypothetical protein